MKTFIKHIALLLLIGLISCSLYAQKDNDVKIKIIKNKDGKTQVIDTIIPFPADSAFAFWNEEEHEILIHKMDSCMKNAHKKLRNINMDSIMQEVEAKVKDIDVHIKKHLNDSIMKHRHKMIRKKLGRLDSLHKHEFKQHQKHLDSIHEQLWIMKPDSMGDFEFELKMNIDSIIKNSHKSLIMLDSLNLPHSLPDVEQIQKSIKEGLEQMDYFMMIESHDDEKPKAHSVTKYLDGKLLKIKTDGAGTITKVIIISPDGKHIEVKKNKEAREFIKENDVKMFAANSEE
jgi:hypothetical protein